MAKFKILDIDKIIESRYKIKEHSTGMSQNKLDSFIRQHGQFKSVLIATVNNENMIVDGTEMFKAMKRMNHPRIVVADMGVISEKNYLLYRIFLNAGNKRLNYIGIAEIINLLGNNENDLITISNTTGIDIKDVKRYKELLEFDWEDFINQKQDENQLNIFDIIDRQ